jgi:succinate dehydrogenase hydrophobic anchor subunit
VPTTSSRPSARELLGGRWAISLRGWLIFSALILVIGMRHFAMGATMMIEDYSRGTARKALVMFVTSLATVIAATGLYALIRIAL